MSALLSLLFACLAFAGPVLIEPVKLDEKEVQEFEKKSCETSVALLQPKEFCLWVAKAVFRATRQLPFDQSRHTAAVDQPTKELVKKTDATQGALCSMGSLYQTVETASTAAKNSAANEVSSLKKAKGYLEDWKEVLNHSHQLEPRIECLGKCGVGAACAKKCQVTVPQSKKWMVYVGVPPDKVLWQNPPLKQSFQASAREQGQLVKFTEELLAGYDIWQKQLESAEANARSQRQLLVGKHKCEVLRQNSASIAEAASRSVHVVEPGRQGSGFYVKTTGPDGKPQYQFVTAQHVAGDIEAGVPNSVDSHTLDAPDRDGKMGVYRSAVEPGKYDRGSDVVAFNAREKEGALEVIKAGEEPKVGQEFQVSGHPGYANSEYQSHTCTFQGYTPAYRGEGTAYLMKCPSAVNTSVGGISGGPVTDYKGRVWGVNSAEYSRQDARYLIVAPVAATQSGSLQYGVQRTFISENCVDQSGNRRRCQIIPGYTNATQGP